MSVNIGYESFYAGSGSLPSISTTAEILEGAQSAIFYVDVNGGPALFRGDGPAPTIAKGLPINPGGHIILVGRTNIANARWENMEPGNTARIHILFYNQVDIVAADLIGRDAPQKTDSHSKEILDALLTQTRMMEHHWGLESKYFKAA